MIWPSIALLAFVTLQRLVELPIAHANKKRLLAAGGHEVGAGHYPLLVAVHAAWLVSLWWLAPGRPIHLPFFALFVLIEFGRIWVLRTLGRRWTTRIIVVPGETLVAERPLSLRQSSQLSGRDRRNRGAPASLRPVAGRAHILSGLNAIALTVRIRAENEGARPLDSLLRDSWAIINIF